MGEYNDIDLNLCKTFLAVAKYGTISKAAEMLYGDIFKEKMEDISFRKSMNESINCLLKDNN